MNQFHLTQEECDEVLETLARFADMYDDEVSVRTDYSGRGMYGDTCIGFVCPSNAVALVSVALFQTLAKRDDESIAWDVMRHAKEDSMGYDTIIYWESLGLEEGEES